MNIIFIHNGLDAAVISKYLAKVLEEVGNEIRYWSSLGSLDNELNSHPDLDAEIEWSEVVIIVINGQISNSRLFDSIIRRGRALNKRIIVLREDECVLSGALDDFIDAAVPCAGDLVMDAVTGEIQGVYSPSEPTPSPRQIPHHKC